MGGTSAADGAGGGPAGGCSSAGAAAGGHLEQLQVMYLYLQAAVVGGQLSEVLAAVNNLVDASSSPACGLLARPVDAVVE